MRFLFTSLFIIASLSSINASMHNFKASAATKLFSKFKPQAVTNTNTGGLYNLGKCSPTCPSDQYCVWGECVTAAQYSATCTSECSGIQSCVFGECRDYTQSCSNCDETSNACLYGLCFPNDGSWAGDFPGAGGLTGVGGLTGIGGNGNPLDGFYGVCTEQCSSDKFCFYGKCITQEQLSDSSCATSCNQGANEICLLGQCTGVNAECSQGCSSGRCVYGLCVPTSDIDNGNFPYPVDGSPSTPDVPDVPDSPNVPTTTTCSRTCDATETCILGRCVTITDVALTCVNDECLMGTACLFGRCISVDEPCPTTCSSSSRCSYGLCIPNEVDDDQLAVDVQCLNENKGFEVCTNLPVTGSVDVSTGGQVPIPSTSTGTNQQPGTTRSSTGTNGGQTTVDFSAAPSFTIPLIATVLLAVIVSAIMM